MRRAAQSQRARRGGMGCGRGDDGGVRGPRGARHAAHRSCPRGRAGRSSRPAVGGAPRPRVSRALTYTRSRCALWLRAVDAGRSSRTCPATALGIAHLYVVLPLPRRRPAPLDLARDGAEGEPNERRRRSFVASSERPLVAESRHEVRRHAPRRRRVGAAPRPRRPLRPVRRAQGGAAAARARRAGRVSGRAAPDGGTKCPRRRMRRGARGDRGGRRRLRHARKVCCRERGTTAGAGRARRA